MNALKGIGVFLKDSFEALILVGTVYMVIYLFLFRPGVVKGTSMEPSMHNNERFFTNIVSYHVSSPQRGDVVVLESPRNQEIEYIKRVIAVGGDTLQLLNGDVYVNGKVITEHYIETKTYTIQGGVIKEGEIISIPKGYVFVMGDNREHSLDSRVFGPVSHSTLIGKAAFIYYPQEKFGFIPSSN